MTATLLTGSTRKPILILGLAVATFNVGTFFFVPWDFAVAQLPWMLTMIPMFVVGVLLMTRAESNAIGPLIFGIAVFASFGNIPGLSERNGGDLYGPIGAALSTMGISLLPLVVLLFPDGELPSSRWRPTRWLVYITAALGGTVAFLAGGWGGDVTHVPRTGFLYERTQSFTSVGQGVFFGLFTVALLIGAAATLVRYVEGASVIRHQIRWLLVGVAMLGSIVVVVTATSGLPGAASGWRAFAIGIGMATIPAAIGVAVLRYRLYDVDVVISRSLVFVLLVGFITLVYAGLVVGAGSLVGGSSLGWSIGATAAVAVLFEPVRDRVQRWVNRLVYGRRATPYEVLSDLTGRLAATEREEGLLQRMAVRLAEGTGADRAIVWIDEGDTLRAVACEPAAELPVEPLTSSGELPGTPVPIDHDGERLGALTVETRRGDALTPTERRLVEDLAGSAGLLMRRLGLDADLERKAQELVESRRRLVDAQDVERRRLERELDVGPQQQVLALKVQLGLAEQHARREGADTAAALIAQMASETQDAIDQIRALANGIYPPLLEAEGLPGAVAALAEVAPVDVQLSVDVHDRHPLPIEGAVYFCISEATTNAVKYANPPILIELSDQSGELTFSVSDAGPGFDLDGVQRGSGLNNMADRLEALGGSVTIESTPGRPTVVTGRVAVADEAGAA